MILLTAQKFQSCVVFNYKINKSALVQELQAARRHNLTPKDKNEQKKKLQMTPDATRMARTGPELDFKEYN